MSDQWQSEGDWIPPETDGDSGIPPTGERERDDTGDSGIPVSAAELREHVPTINEVREQYAELRDSARPVAEILADPGKRKGLLAREPAMVIGLMTAIIPVIVSTLIILDAGGTIVAATIAGLTELGVTLGGAGIIRQSVTPAG